MDKENQLKILNVNCQGLGETNKRKDVLNHLKAKNYNVYFIQDTHFVNTNENLIQTQWGYKVLQNGFSSKYFKPQRGCRQGDPISSYLFLLCAEILGILIRNNKDIKGITIAGEEYKISQYADDTSLVTNGSPESLNGILIELDMFASISGLRINFTKTIMVWIGSKKFQKMFFITLDGNRPGIIQLLIC